MLATADRHRLLGLMGVPLYVQRSEPEATPVETPAPDRTATVDMAPAARAPVVIAPAAIPPVTAPRVTPVSRTVPGSHRLGLVAAGLAPPGLTRDLLQALGQKNLLQAPTTWPDYAVLLGDVANVPASVIVVRAALPLRDARAKRAVWRQLRPLLAELRRP